MQNETGRVPRFNLMERVGHWTHAVACIFLLATGLALVFSKYGDLMGPNVLRVFRTIHHGLGYVFVFVPLGILLFGTGRTFLAWIKACFKWSKNDVGFLLGFPREFFGFKVQLPKQGKFNGGEKVNSLITMATFWVMAVTGLIMLNPEGFSRTTMLTAYTLHAAGALTLGTVLIGHVYLALLHPGSKESMKGMIWGTVSQKFAKEHHALWYDEVTSGGKAVKESGNGPQVIRKL
ncbi:MAG: formate dehydrogenase subunit gamma [Bacillota bacterium]